MGLVQLMKSQTSNWEKKYFCSYLMKLSDPIWTLVLTVYQLRGLGTSVGTRLKLIGILGFCPGWWNGHSHLSPCWFKRVHEETQSGSGNDSLAAGKLRFPSLIRHQSRNRQSGRSISQFSPWSMNYRWENFGHEAEKSVCWRTSLLLGVLSSYGRMQYSCGHPLYISELNVALSHGSRPNLKLPDRWSKGRPPVTWGLYTSCSELWCSGSQFVCSRKSTIQCTLHDC